MICFLALLRKEWQLDLFPDKKNWWRQSLYQTSKIDKRGIEAVHDELSNSFEGKCPLQQHTKVLV